MCVSECLCLLQAGEEVQGGRDRGIPELPYQVGPWPSAFPFGSAADKDSVLERMAFWEPSQ